MTGETERETEAVNNKNPEAGQGPNKNQKLGTERGPEKNQGRESAGTGRKKPSKFRESGNPLVKMYFKLWDIFTTREMITYLISGVLTTLVNWVLYWLIVERFGMEELSGNAVDWILTVAFAYVINALWVFRSKFTGWNAESGKIFRFYAARFLTFLVEEGGILLFVKKLHFNGLIVKAALAVIVIILNYVFSKLFVFLKKPESKNLPEE